MHMSREAVLYMGSTTIMHPIIVTGNEHFMYRLPVKWELHAFTGN